MDFKQTTIDEIIESEREMVLTGAERYGIYFDNAFQFNALLNAFVKSVDPGRFIFAMFLAQVRKHATLALFSIVRWHHVQTMMNLRQVLEAGACAAYATANSNPVDFADTDEDGFLNASKDLTKKRYDWLDKNYPAGAAAIHNMKKSINVASHANIVHAHNTFKFDKNSSRFETPFFDIEDEFHVKGDLWTIGNILMGLMDLFYGVNINRDVIKFTDDFVPELKRLEVVNNKLKTEMMNSKRLRAYSKS